MERPWLGPGVGREQELDLVDPGGGEPQPPPVDEQRLPDAVVVVGDLALGHGHLDPRVRHRQQGQLGGDLVGQPGRGGGARRRQRRSGGAELLAQVRALGAELLDPPVGVVELEEPGRRLLGPVEHLVDGLAVLAGQRRQRRSPLRDGGQAGRVGLQPRGVGRHVGGDVGEQVGDLGQPVGQLAGLGVVVADAVEEGAGGRRGGQGVGLLLVAREGLARLLGGGAQLVGVPQPRLLRRQGGIFAGLGLDRLHLAEPEPQQVGLAGPVASGGDDLVQLALGGEQALVEDDVVGQQGGDLLPAEPVERLALRPRLEQAVLVGLPVHRDQRLGHLGQHGHRHRGAPDERAGAALGRDVAGRAPRGRPRPLPRRPRPPRRTG